MVLGTNETQRGVWACGVSGDGIGYQRNTTWCVGMWGIHMRRPLVSIMSQELSSHMEHRVIWGIGCDILKGFLRNGQVIQGAPCEFYMP